MIDLKSRFPVAFIEDDCLVGADESITVGFQIVRSSAVYSISEQAGIEINDFFMSSLKLLPKGTTFHKQDFYYLENYKANLTGKDSWVKKKNEEYYQGRTLLKHYSNIYISFRENNKLKKNIGSSSLFKKIVIGEDFKENKFKIFLKNSSNYTDTFLNTINASGKIIIKRMDQERLLAALYDYYNQTYETPVEDGRKTAQPLKSEDGFLRIGGKYVAVVSMVEESEALFILASSKTAPGEVYGNGVYYDNKVEIKTSHTHPLGLGLPVNHVVNTIIEVYDNDDIIDYTKKIYNQLNIGQSIKHDKSLAKRSEIELFNNTITNNNYQGCLVSINIVLCESDKSRLISNLNKVPSAFKNMNNAECYIENEMAESLFFSCIPSAATWNNRTFVSTLSHAVCYINKETVYKSDPVGHTFIDRYGTPVVIDMWDLKGISNRNFYIIAPAGSGKSFLTNFMISEDLNFGFHVVILDKGHSYRRFCDIYQGKYFDSSDSSKFEFNIFTTVEKDQRGKYILKSGSGDEISYNVNYVKTVLGTIWKPEEKITFNESNTLDKIIEDFYEFINKNGMFPDMDVFYDFIDVFYKDENNSGYTKFIDKDSLRNALRKYKRGEVYGKFLNGKEPIDILNDSLVVFDVEAISEGDPTLFNVITVIIMELVTKKIVNLEGIKKAFIIDEGYMFMKNEKMGSFISDKYQTIRKKEGQVGVITQNINFFDSVPEIVRNSVFGNTDTVIVLRHPPEGIKDLIARGSIFPEHEEAMKSLIEVGQFLMRRGNNWFGTFKAQVSKEVEMTFTSWQSEIKEINEYMKENGIRDPRIAIEHYVKNK